MIGLSLLFVVSAGPLRADTLLKRQVTADRFAVPAKVDAEGRECRITVQKPGPGEIVTIYLDADHPCRFVIIVNARTKREIAMKPTSEILDDRVLLAADPTSQGGNEDLPGLKKPSPFANRSRATW